MGHCITFIWTYLRKNEELNTSDKEKGINGRNNLRYADYIVLIAKDLQELKTMLVRVSAKVGLQINKSRPQRKPLITIGDK